MWTSYLISRICSLIKFYYSFCSAASKKQTTEGLSASMKATKLLSQMFWIQMLIITSSNLEHMRDPDTTYAQSLDQLSSSLAELHSESSLRAHTYRVYDTELSAIWSPVTHTGVFLYKDA